MKFPKVKFEHLPFRTGSGSVRIGGDLYGLAAEIRDPNGWIWAALGRMDGTRTVEQIVTGLCTEFPALTPTSADRLVQGLIGTGYVEDEAGAGTDRLSATERARYAKNQAFFRRIDLRPRESQWDAQLKLKDAGVVVLGVGGTGSHAAWALAAAGVGRVHCVDPDRVELSNLTRQVLYTEADLGRPKAEVAAERLRAVNSDVEVSHATRAVDSRAALAELVAGYDALALCADEPDGETLRGWASDVCAQTGVPWVGGGYNGPFVSVGTFTREGPCFQCVAAGEEARLPAGPPPKLGGSGVLAASAGISGNLVAYELITLLTGVSRLNPGYMRVVNLIAPDDQSLTRHESRPDCPNCHA
ncbi:molybdopterin/thiamine biosynthesis adenylyltransferase [Kitasatospora sp. GP30]|uniref:HesA/MoeB/ThiF family protein n=1 Tax=Kitasatospora sp. GP30 TaxID=3035084 RepID=UPI000C7051FF|nr:ThiF family adenylyltransferase [Kitasatospora sp. GP30]MDH6143603.1 molybdopterin/thiamine biosynthesis adenylyltransferase [Kitasatospora sp. GP30]